MQIKHPTVSLNINNESSATERQEENVETFIYSNNTTGDSNPSTSREKITSKDNTVSLEPTKLFAQGAQSEQSYQTDISVFIPKRLTQRGKQIIDEKLIRLFTDTYQPFWIIEKLPFVGLLKLLILHLNYPVDT
ncbi:unnamed protein product [Psylliodes chrysocephalus]|uniref:Uncharacterized protein n=1 Tax=Psylliodes chrysocephalus TaxID=3402493 RepID=A0A9P0GB80_9CUCU|nr:unnamed protein product [Psylliodes chrysocephala]